jgi:hypothetical protein
MFTKLVKTKLEILDIINQLAFTIESVLREKCADKPTELH